MDVDKFKNVDGDWAGAGQLRTLALDTGVPYAPAKEFFLKTGSAPSADCVTTRFGLWSSQ